VTSGASSDIQQATRTAASMVKVSPISIPFHPWMNLNLDISTSTGDIPTNWVQCFTMTAMRRSAHTPKKRSKQKSARECFYFPRLTSPPLCIFSSSHRRVSCWLDPLSRRTAVAIFSNISSLCHTFRRRLSFHQTLRDGNVPDPECGRRSFGFCSNFLFT